MFHCVKIDATEEELQSLMLASNKGQTVHCSLEIRSLYIRILYKIIVNFQTLGHLKLESTALR